MRNRAILNSVLLVSLAVAGCSGSKEPEKIATPVKAALVTPLKSGDEIRYSANIEPKHAVHLAFKVGGYVEALYQVANGTRTRNVQPGDRVKRGAVLARIRKSDFDAKLEQTRSTLGQTKAQADRAQQDFERASRLYENGSLTRSDYDAAKAAADAAQFQVRAAAAQIEEATIALRDSDLTAPIDGIINERRIETGDLVNPGTVGFILADSSDVEAVFGVPDVSVAQFQIGQRMTVLLEALPAMQFEGTISRVSPAADSKTRLFDIELTIANLDQRLKTGMIATIIVPGSAPNDVSLVVPITAIVRSSNTKDSYAVMVVQTQGGRRTVRQRDVRLGETFGDTISVTTGLRAGEMVVTTGATLVTDGDEVNIIP